MKKAKSTILCPLMVALALLGSSCSSFQDFLGNTPEEQELTAEEADRYNFIRRDRNEEFPDRVKAIEEEVVMDPDYEEVTNNIAYEAKTISVPLAKRPTASGQEKEQKITADPFYEDLLLIDDEKEIPVQISLSSAPVIDAMPAFADALGFNFIVDSEIKSVITVSIDSMMTSRELWETLDEMLYMAGCSATLDGQIVRIVPISKLGAMRGIRVGDDQYGESEVLFYPLKNITAETALELVKPFAGTDCIIKTIPTINAMLIADNPTNMKKVTEILDMVDAEKRALWPRMVFKCERVVPTMVAAELSALLPILGFTVDLTTTGSSSDEEDAGAVQIMGFDRLQMLVVSAATEEALKEISEWVRILDSTDSSTQERVYVYKVTNSRADQLAQALTTVFNITDGTTMTVDSTESVGTSSNTSTIANDSSSSSSVDSLSNTMIDRVSSVYETDVRLFADAIYNRLVIRTTPRCYAMIKALLDKLDVVPPQVLIQILLIEITLDDTTEFGIEFSYNDSTSDAESLLQTSYDGLQASENGGFSYLLTNPNNPEQTFGYLRAQAGKSNLKVISSPQVLVASNQEAIVQVGEDVPIQTESIADTSDTSNLLQSFEYRETGIILTITPQITSNDLISFEISQEISETTTNTASTINSPAISMRKVETTMTIANGRTMIMGGLIQERDYEELDSLPIISEIPLINSLFGNTNTEKKRTELLMMITGYIISERSPVEDMLRRYNESVKALNTFENGLESKALEADIQLEEFIEKVKANHLNLGKDINE